jgi:hypothetical protein
MTTDDAGAPQLFPSIPILKTIRRRAPRASSLERILHFPNRDLLDWIEGRAQLNERTLTQEIIFRLRRAKEGQEKSAAAKWIEEQALLSRLTGGNNTF